MGLRDPEYRIAAVLPPDAWLKRAACNPQLAELFWPVTKEVLTRDTQRALNICGRCPVIRDCGQWAIDNGFTAGIWGGMRPDQLRRLVADRQEVGG